ncbi:MAG: 2-iminoacetate synthase ThiH, partial [Proteobacteria bacterium]|nr:2-iminoacetate synthase ThiH [Pseudomonadota bacterium]
KQFGRAVQLYTPLYLSNYCSNGCVYCGFNRDQSIERTRLTPDEIRKEAENISRSGLQHILILTGGDRKRTGIDYILESVSILKEYFSSISIEVYTLTKDEYRSLVEAGVNNVTIYQETYNRSLYQSLHKYGEKADYGFRLNAPERAAASGVNSVNIGVLLGLDNPVTDFFKACLHGDYIRKKYPGTEVALSFPRIRPAAGGFTPEFTATDRLLVKFMCAFRLFLPRGEISISTRESAQLRDNLLPLGTTRMSAGSVTSVGSRSRSKKTEDQFQIADTRTVSELDFDLRKMGYQPVYKDWDIL